MHALLKKYELTQTKVANVLNCSQYLVSKWCRGICEPSLNAIIKLHKTFNIPIEEIVFSFEKEQKDAERSSNDNFTAKNIF